jgi:hypothetical protein
MLLNAEGMWLLRCRRHPGCQYRFLVVAVCACTCQAQPRVRSAVCVSSEVGV